MPSNSNQRPEGALTQCGKEDLSGQTVGARLPSCRGLPCWRGFSGQPLDAKARGPDNPKSGAVGWEEYTVMRHLKKGFLTMWWEQDGPSMRQEADRCLGPGAGAHSPDQCTPGPQMSAAPPGYVSAPLHPPRRPHGATSGLGFSVRSPAWG